MLNCSLVLYIVLNVHEPYCISLSIEKESFHVSGLCFYLFGWCFSNLNNSFCPCWYKSLQEIWETLSSHFPSEQVLLAWWLESDSLELKKCNLPLHPCKRHNTSQKHFSLSSKMTIEADVNSGSGQKFKVCCPAHSSDQHSCQETKKHGLPHSVMAERGQHSLRG